MKNKKGITLVALIITIIVMVILAGVIIVSAVADGGVIDRAQIAMQENERADVQEIIIGSYVFKVTASTNIVAELDLKQTGIAMYNNLTANGFTVNNEDNTTDENGNTVKTVKVDETNKKIEVDVEGKHGNYIGTVTDKGLKEDLEIVEDEDIGNTNPSLEDDSNADWILAWTCTDGTWSDTITRENEETNNLTGDIVAKLYPIEGERTTEKNIEDIIIPAGQAYHLVIEKNGQEETYEMGDICELDSFGTPGDYFAWHSDISKFGSGTEEEDFPKILYISKVTIGEGILNIPMYAFSMCMSLQSVTIPEGVTSIGEMAFNSCTNLINAILPDSVNTLGMRVFYCCKNLQNIVLSKNIKELTNEMFYMCNSLTEVTIPKGVTTLDVPFNYCENLKTVRIPLSVTYIAGNTFGECNKIESILYEGNKEQWDEIEIGTTSLPESPVNTKLDLIKYNSYNYN